jgi:hypothetical protein
MPSDQLRQLHGPRVAARFAVITMPRALTVEADYARMAAVAMAQAPTKKPSENTARHSF